MSRNLWYELFSVIYVVHKLLLIHSFTAVIFLKQELPSSIVPIQMPDHGRVRLALGHNMMFNLHDFALVLDSNLHDFNGTNPD